MARPWPRCGRSAPTQPPTFDLISMMAHSEATRDMPTARVHRQLRAADRRRQRHHAQLHERRADGAVSRTRRSSTWCVAARADPEPRLRDHPLADAGDPHAPHRARDTELAGRKIAKGDKVVMWYVSGNRDERQIERAERFVDRSAEGAPASRPSAPASIAASATGSPSCSSDPVGGDTEARSALRDRGAGEAALFELHPRHPLAAGEDRDLIVIAERSEAIHVPRRVWIASSRRASQ